MMDDRSFDTLVRSLASGANRRQLLKGLFGLGGAAIAGTTMSGAEAARRPTPTPRPPSCPGQQTWNGAECVCPAGSDTCGPDCCPTGVAQCCDQACCYGVCYGEELCCPTGREFCPITGECCPDGWRCCPEYGCIAPGQCCTTEECSPPLCFTSECTADHVCSEPVSDCNDGGAGACCLEGQICLEDGSCCTPQCDGCGGDDGCGGTCACPAGQVCLDDGSCCTPVCDGVACGASDSCGGTCACPEGYGCGEDGVCHVCTVCAPVSETCGEIRSCYTFCTFDGVVCLSGFAVGICSSQTDCPSGTYCMDTCVGLRCLAPCGPDAARVAAPESEGIDVIAG